MATTVKLDHLSLLETEEQYGALVRLVRVARVSGIEDLDYNGLISAINTVGIPENGDLLAEDINLVVTNRSVRILNNSKDKADVTITYEAVNNDGQNFRNAPLNGVILTHNRCLLQQVNTNKYTDENGTEKLIEVKYTYPDGSTTYTDPDGNTVTLDPDPTRPGKEDRQGGEISVTEIQQVVTATGLIQAAYPWNIVNQIVNAVNDREFLKGAVGTWKCVNADWTLHDADTSAGEPVYNLSVEFQYNATGWQPQVVYIDPETGKPPPGLVEDVGYKTIEYYRKMDFAKIIGGSWILY